MTTFNITPKPEDGTNELLEKLLKRSHADYIINYEGYFANHLSHGIYSLWALGASKSRLQEFNDMYVKRLDPLRKPTFTMNSTNWNKNIGNRKLYTEFLQYFDDEITSKGLKATFDLYIDQILSLSLGAVLHPLIHIGYAMEFSNSDLLAEGFAYACIYPSNNINEILDDIDSVDASGETVLNIIEELQGIQFPEFPYNTTYHDKAELVFENHGAILKNLIAKWDLTQVDQFPAKLNELTEASILGVFATFLNEIDFYILHGLTGNHAVRMIFPHLSVATQRYILRINLLGILSFFVVQGKPKIDVGFVTGYKESESDESISWDRLVKMGISVDEEHVIKVVRSLIYYVETVPISQRSALFSDQFIRRCAFKAVDRLHDIDDYTGLSVERLMIVLQDGLNIK